ncbi:alpha/beta hydrolase [Aurantiacibacter aquimixticola]|uniref:Alpha/beta fold hydrolase n=1 Tax=Aurantiacibacter aquimixticola TaxID=1958945 RepID=A0A419RUP1_9SPHN|nr:alpha/beta fold hydrolase [Aurantiacibacter aquimixticola]RJY09501.1 alpha/beta fold hydrolase [Aurantiacibacter aquimixticola]
MLGVAALVLATIYLGAVVLAWIFQERLIYPVPPVDNGVPPGFVRVTYRTDDGLDLKAGYRTAAPGKPTLLFFHGNGASWQSTAMVTEDLAASGFGILAAEYRGYSGNPGSPSEQGLYRDGRAAWRCLAERGVTDIVLVGNSIGSGVAVQLASEVEASALVLISPFDSLEETVSRRMRWLPVRMLLRDTYDNAGKLDEIAEPVLILHGEGDTLISLDQAQTLAAVRNSTVMETYPGWGHDLIVHTPIQQRIARFLDEQSKR